MAETMSSYADLCVYHSTSPSPRPSRTSVVYIYGATVHKSPTRILSTSVQAVSSLEFTPYALQSPLLCEFVLWQKLVTMRLEGYFCNLAASRIASLAMDVQRWYGDGVGFNLTVMLDCVVNHDYPSLINPVNYNYSYGGDQEEEVLVLDDEGSDYSRSLWLGQESGGRGVSEAVIDKLRRKGMEEPSNVQAGGTCAVCLDEMMSKTGVLRMPCSHLFHDRCIVPWLERNNSCPMCRKTII